YLTQQKDAISKVGQADAEFQEIGDAVSRAEMLSLLDEQDRRMGFKESVLAAARLRRESNRLGRPRSLVDTSQLDVSALPGACAECATNSLPSSDHGHQHKSSLLTTDHPKVEKSSSLEAAYLTPSTITPEMIRAGVEALFSFYSDELGHSAPRHRENSTSIACARPSIAFVPFSIFAAICLSWIKPISNAAGLMRAFIL